MKNYLFGCENEEPINAVITDNITRLGYGALSWCDNLTKCYCSFGGNRNCRKAELFYVYRVDVNK